MPNRGPFPDQEAAFNTYLQAACPYLEANKTRLGISTDNSDALNTDFGSWNTKYRTATTAATRTKIAIQEKDAARGVIEGTMRTIFADIPQSVLTTTDRDTLNLPERDSTHTPAPVPTTRPVGQVDTGERLQHTISFRDEAGAGKAKPAGVRGCQIWARIGGTTPPVSASELTYIATDTKTPYVLHFDGADGGKNVYYWLRWENTRGETGPWSEAVMATIGA